MKSLIIIGAGGVAGSISRYYLSLLVQKASEAHFPYGTLLVNIAGCVLIGFVMQYAVLRPHFSNELKVFLTTGFAGAFTTFSTFSFESVSLMMAGHHHLAMANIFISNIVGLMAVGAGIFIASLIA